MQISAAADEEQAADGEQRKEGTADDSVGTKGHGSVCSIATAAAEMMPEAAPARIMHAYIARCRAVCVCNARNMMPYAIA